MPATVRAASAASLILFALGAPAAAAAMEEKSTKPRIAVLEFKNQADAQLQIDSVQWGEWIADVERPRAAGSWAKVDGLGISRDVAESRGTAGKQPKSRPMVLAPGATRPQAARGQIGDPEDMNIGVGELQEGPGGDPDRPVITGHLPNPDRPASAPETGDEVLVAMEHGDSASGQATGKRQHKPITITKEWDAATPQLMKRDRPAARGSVMLRLAQPWAGCAVGDRFNGVYLTTGVTHKYRLDGAQIVGCGGSTVTINYAKFASEGSPVR